MQLSRAARGLNPSRFRYLLGASVLILAGSHAFAQTCVAPSCWPGKFYKFEVMAQAPSTIPLATPVYLTGFGNQPSINEFGMVAFVGQTSVAPASSANSSDGLFMNNGVGAPTYATEFPNFFNAKRSFDSAVQISNINQIVARDTIPGSPPPSYIRVWDGNHPAGIPCPTVPTVLCINETDIAIGTGTSTHFSSVLTQPAINGSSPSQVVFSALDPSTNAILVTPNGSSSYNTTKVDNIPLRPMIDDAGNIVTRKGSLASDPIVEYQNNLAASFVIGDTSSDFSMVGQSPGVSRDGAVAAFAGNMTQAGALHWNTNAGPGIFIAIIQDNAVSRIIRVAGFSSSASGSACSPGYLQGVVLGTTCVESTARDNINISYPDPVGQNYDGYCDTGELCVSVYELEDFPPICLGASNVCVEGTGGGAYFSTFDPAIFPTSTAEWNQRVGITHADFGPASTTAVVSFVATPNAASALNLFSGNSGLWTVQIDLAVQSGTIVPKVHKPIPVIQVGDKLGSQTTVTAISVYDPIANALADELGNARVPTPGDHQVAFWVSTITPPLNQVGQMVIRGTHEDTDGDGLLDHWEEYGIDFDGDGTIDLNLAQLDPTTLPDPRHIDLYFEADYMCNGSVTQGSCIISGVNGHTHDPRTDPWTGNYNPADPIGQIVTAFNNSPVVNRDGTTGIHVHIETDEAMVEIPVVVWDNPPGLPGSFQALKWGSGPCSGGRTPGILAPSQTGQVRTAST